MKKKLLFIIWSYTYGGGAEALLTTIVNHLNPDKYDISIIEFHHAEIKTEPVRAGVHVLPCIEAIETPEKHSKTYQLYHTPEVLIDAYIEKGYDLYISFNYQIPTFLLPKGTKNIAWVHSDVYDLAEEAMQRERRRQDTAFYNIRKIVAISDYTEQSIRDLFPGHSDKIVKIYNGVDTEAIRKKSLESTEIIIKGPSIAFVGRLEARKAPVRLVHVLHLVHKRGVRMHLYYLGQGEEQARIIQKAGEYGLTEFVHLLGYQHNPYPIIRQCDVVCLLSKSEGFSMCLLESITLGKAFVASSVGGAEELSNHQQCGRIIKTDEDAAIAVCELLEMKKEEIRSACQESLKRFELMHYIEQVESLFDSVMDEEDK